MVPDLIFETLMELPKHAVPEVFLRFWLRRHQRLVRGHPECKFTIRMEPEEDDHSFTLYENDLPIVVMVKSEKEELRVYTEISNGHRNGLSLEWYNDGTLKYLSHYLDSRFHGLQCKWYPNGQLRYQFTHADGMFQGLYVSFKESGEAESLLYYKNGIRIFTN